jgi:hypothetical protein
LTNDYFILFLLNFASVLVALYIYDYFTRRDQLKSVGSTVARKPKTVEEFMDNL